MTNRPDFMNRFRKPKPASATTTSTSTLNNNHVIHGSNSHGLPGPATRGFLWRKQKERSNSISSTASSSSPDPDCSNCRCREVYSANLNQDIISLKTYLLKLRRVLQDNALSSEDLESSFDGGDPDSSCSLGAAQGSRNAQSKAKLQRHHQMLLSRSPSISMMSNFEDEINDLKREVVFLQQQVIFIYVCEMQ